MSRISKAYIARLRGLLQRAHARQLDRAVELLVAKARRMSVARGTSLADSLQALCEHLAGRPYFQRTAAPGAPLLFFCDTGLGGLARWLRAAGYEAHWEAGIDDELLLEKTRELSATVLTTDSIMMERRVLRDGLLPALWLPPTLKIPEQLALFLPDPSNRWPFGGFGIGRLVGVHAQTEAGVEPQIKHSLPPSIQGQ